ncbi:MAG: recombinase family protein [Desulfobacteraceae bacterium]|nr:recombinase family protein [Desulfobacteraceae bacterium]
MSTNEQAKEGISLRHQEEKIKAYAALHEMELVEITRDEGLSAKTVDKRPGATRVIDMAATGEAEAIVVYKLDRMFRNAAEALRISQELNNLGVALHSVTERLDTQSAMGKFFFTIMAAAAEMERNLISERTRDALRHKKALGEVYNHAPYGYDIVERKLVPNKVEQKVIARILTLRDDKMSLQCIASDLNNEGIRTKKGKAWFPKTVSDVIKNAECLAS